MKQQDEITKRDVLNAQTDLLEHFDEDISVDILNDLTLHITSARAPSLDIVARLASFTEGKLDNTVYSLGTSKAPPQRLSTTAGVTGVQLSEFVYLRRTTQELAKQKQLLAKSGKTK